MTYGDFFVKVVFAMLLAKTEVIAVYFELNYVAFEYPRRAGAKKILLLDADDLVEAPQKITS